jgi:hypothetical protein
LRYSATSSRLGTATCRKRQLAAKVRAPLEEHLDGQQPLDDALGVVEPVDAEQQRPARELLPESPDFVAGRGVAGERG